MFMKLAKYYNQNSDNDTDSDYYDEDCLSSNMAAGLDEKVRNSI